MSEWISVDDRLPDPLFDWVLVYQDEAMACMMYTIDRGFHGHTENCISITEITHWMPLPEPPNKPEVQFNTKQEGQYD